MRYGKKPTGGMWVMSIQLRSAPLCPGCCEELQGVVVEIRNGWGWCPICAVQQLHRDKLIRYVLATDRFRSLSTLQHGLRFYTPECTQAQAGTACSFLADADLPEVPLAVADDGPIVQVRLPGGVHGVEEVQLGLTRLGEMELEMRNIRDRRHARLNPR